MHPKETQMSTYRHDDPATWANSPEAWERTKFWRSRVEHLGRVLDEHHVGDIADSCHEDTTDLIGAEPTDDFEPATAEWFRQWALSMESEIDAQLGLDYDLI